MPLVSPMAATLAAKLTTIETDFEVSFAINELGKLFHDISKDKGFWEGVTFVPPGVVDPDDENNHKDIATKISLIADEAFEALREHRKGDDHLIGEELADTIIRSLELGHALGFDMGDLLLKKTKKNIDRPYRHNRRY